MPTLALAKYHLLHLQLDNLFHPAKALCSDFHPAKTPFSDICIVILFLGNQGEPMKLTCTRGGVPSYQGFGLVMLQSSRGMLWGVMLSEVRFVLLQGNICPDFYALEIGSAAACHHFQGPRHTQARRLFLSSNYAFLSPRKLIRPNGGVRTCTASPA